MKRIIIFSLTFILFIVGFCPVYASADDMAYEEVYEILPDSVRNSFENNGIDSLSDLISEINENGFGVIIDIVFGSISLPFSSMVTVITISVSGGMLSAFTEKNELKKITDIIFSLIICGVLVYPLKDLIVKTTDCINSCGVFLYAFLPIFATFMTVSQNTTSSVMYTSSTYLFTQVFMFLSKNILVPASVGYFGISLASVISDNIFKDLLTSLKKTAIWCLTFITTVFAAMTSVQSVVASAADSVITRTGKYIIGTSIPVVGGYVSEVLNTVIGGINVMRSGLGLFAIVVIIVLFVPLLAELIAWILAVKLCSFVATSDNNSAVINAFYDVLSLFTALIVCIFIGMILSLSAMLILGGLK